MDAGFKREVERKVAAGERLSREDGITLYGSDDLAWLGGLAHRVRTQKNGDAAYFTTGRRLDLTGHGGKDTHTLSVEEAVRLAGEMTPGQLTGLHLVAGPHPALPWPFYPRVVRALKEALPAVCVTAFTATAIRHLESTSGLSAGEILDELIDAGLSSLAGGDAGIFGGKTRRQSAGRPARWQDWSRIHRLAHEKGITTPCTMLYGQAEEPHHRVDHLLLLRELQDETGGFNAFMPLRHQHGGHTPADGTRPDRPAAATATPAESLKTFAVSRLLLDNVPHVKASWATHGLQTAALALNHGADHIDGLAARYTITHDADTCAAPDTASRESLIGLIRDAGFRPVESTTLYRTVRQYEGPDPELREAPQPMRV